MNQQPNALWISFEDCLPLFNCYGDPVAHTPNLDRLAAEGCRWTHAYSTAPVCSPARSAVITGMYPASIGTHHHRTSTGRGDDFPHAYEAVVPHYVKCIPEYLRAAGYYCCNNWKTDYQFAPPRTAWDDCSKEAHWRNRSDPTQPFFAVWNLPQTHESQMWEGKWPDIERTLDEVDLNAIPVPPYFPDTDKVRRSIARMYANIEYNDRRLGEILAELEEDGLADNTAVFIWTDHGPMPRGKRWLYDSGVHSPLIVRWPGYVKPSTVSDQPISTVDLGPTVLSLCNVDIPQHVQGRAFLGAQAQEGREYVFAAADRFDIMYSMARAVRDRRFKYIRHYQPGEPFMRYNAYRNIHPIMQELWRLHARSELTGAAAALMEGKRPPEELFDTEADPHEINNLAADPGYAADLTRLRSALKSWQHEIGDLGLVPEDAMVRQMWPDDTQPVTEPPMFVSLGESHHGTARSDFGGEFEGPLLLQMQSNTQGASIAWCFVESDKRAEGKEAWQLYREPLRLATGTYHVRARAVRIGYAESAEVGATFIVH